ncbi:MAG: hypothetical protein ACTSVI_08595 [Promethearchaeota archaeon]
MDNSNKKKRMKSELSSYEKGIQNILTNMEKYEALIWKYILRVNSKFYSKEFPSTQIAKIIVNNLNIEKTKYPIFHKVIRIILDRWQEMGICELISKSRASNAKKTKEVYRFKESGLKKIKAKFIDRCINDIINEDEIEQDINVLRTRDRIINDINFSLTDF